ncbi:MAG: hypothetical protein ACOX55_07290 [Christensenellales bacterium]
MSKFLVDFFADDGVDTLLDRFCKVVRDQYEKAQLKRKLTESFQRYFEEHFETFPISKEFDINGLHTFLIDNIDNRVAKCFCAGSQKECLFHRDSLISYSYEKFIKADAPNKEQKQGIFAYVQSFLQVIEEHILSQAKPQDLFLAHRQTEEITDTTKEIVQAEAENLEERLKSFLEHHGSFAEYIDSIAIPTRSKVQFHYLNPDIGFVRREEPFKLLDAFLEDDAPLRSIVITGPGGIGKSKLLHHYMLELAHNLEWKAVTLTRSQVQKVCNEKEWKYPKNLLLVLDYAAESPQTIGNWVREMHASTSRPQKMRIVMLERQGILQAEHQRIEPLWYQQLDRESGEAIREIQYQDGFYELPRLDKAEMLQVMDMLPAAKTKLTPADKESIYQKIESFSDNYQDERFNTPLIALLLADARVEGKEADIPDPKHLLDYIIERAHTSWKQFLKRCGKPQLFDPLERLVAYATATDGCDLTRACSHYCTIVINMIDCPHETDNSSI